MAGKVAVVTGAGSGIGRELALGLTSHGARVALGDVDDEGLAGTAAQVEALGGQAFTRHLDVGDRAAFEQFANEVVEHHGVVHQIYNNAGISGGGKTVAESGFDDWERLFAVNLWGVIHGTKLFLPHIIASGDGHVVNISSLNGFMAQPLLGEYVTAKFAVRGFTESLASEMALHRLPVKVTVVHPGGVKTNIASASLKARENRGESVTDEDRAKVALYNEKLLRMPPRKAARIIIEGVEAGRARVLVGDDAKAVDLFVRAVPALAPRLVAAISRRLLA